MQRTNRYWLERVLTGSARYPQQLDWSRSLTRDYASISEAELSGLARRFLDNRRSAEIIIRPEAGAEGSLADAAGDGSAAGHRR
jgi:zinc protease